ncbi:MAG: hypothetical protein HC879_10940 [Leptolyngbyaceae cyanobacterium SL_5_9]|nr:hypothetical protein [Leptolyngbyaceae cyanobacterium SL_5_9]
MISTNKDVWRARNLLVMRRGAQLPDRCVKTNQPAKGKRFKTTLYWHHPAIYLLLLLNVLIYIIVAITVRKKAVIHIGVTEEVLQKRGRAILWGWGAGIAGVVLFFSALAIPSGSAVGGLFALLSPFLILGGLIGGIARSTLISVDRIEDEYVWIRGVSKEYLALLPEWNSNFRV